MSSIELVDIFNAVKDDLVALDFWGSRVEFGEDEDAVPTFPMVLPCAIIHPIEVTYADKTGHQSKMEMTLGITYLADMIERRWTLVGQVVGGLDLAHVQTRVREKFKRTTFGGLVSLGNVVAHAKPQRAIYEGGGQEQRVFRATSTLYLLNEQAG